MKLLHTFAWSQIPKKDYNNNRYDTKKNTLQEIVVDYTTSPSMSQFFFQMNREVNAKVATSVHMDDDMDTEPIHNKITNTLIDTSMRHETFVLQTHMRHVDNIRNAILNLMRMDIANLLSHKDILQMVMLVVTTTKDMQAHTHVTLND